MKKIFAVMIMISLLISAGCGNGSEIKKEEQSVSVSEIQSSVESSAASKEVSEKSVAESSVEESQKSKSEEISESESSAEIKTVSEEESKEESKDESIAESSAESKTEESSKDEISEEESSEEESSEDEEEYIPVTNKKIAGFYNLTEWTENGETVLDLKSHNDRGLFATVTINNDGTGEFDDFGTVVELQWNDKYIILDGEKTRYRLENGMLILFDEGREMIFESADRETLIPSDKEKAELSGSVDKSYTGKYVLSGIFMDGTEDITDVVDEEEWYIVLNQDGTGKWSSGDEVLDIKWTKGQILNENEIFYYTVEEDILTMEVYGITMKYKKV